MKLFFRTIVIVCVAFLFSNQVTAQVYPVQLNPIYNIPYSSKISDYATSMDEKVRLIVNPTDITINNRQVRLKLYIQGNGINAQSNNYVQGLNPIYINGGELITLTNLDFAALFQLQNLEGLNAVQYANPLPDGLYTVCFEMYDYITNQRLTQKSCTNLYFQLNDPPLLNIPTKNEQIPVTDFPNILFTWTPRQINATNVSYKFELKEILDPTSDPQFAFQVSPLLLEESLFSTALLYDLSKPTLIAGKTYAWRVKAISTSGLSENNVFKNNGYSEIFWFKYLAICPPPTYLLSEAQSTSRVKLTWQGNPENKKYHVQYKKNNVANAEWFSIYTLNTQATISDLEPGVTYDFRVGATCETFTNIDLSYVYSGINEFTMPEEDVTNNNNYNCGINPDFSITNQTPITNLIINETFTAGDFPVKILEINGNGTYTGKGYIIVPYLADTKLAVEFENVTINTDYQLVSGIVETTYNPNWTNVSDIEDLTDNGDISIKEIPFVITDITINGAGDIVVNGPNGEQIIIPGGGNVQIVDTKGNVYTVDPDGNIQGPFQQAAGGAPTPENTDGVNQNGQATSITAEGVLITFQKEANNVYGFDGVAADTHSRLKDLYTKLGSDYYMPYKSILNSAQGGVDDYIIANIEITDTNIIADSIVFKTQKGIKIESQRIGNTSEYKLILKGSFKNTEGDILASIKQGDKYKIAGAFKLLYLSKRTTAKVILVNTDTATIPNNATLQNYLNETYKGAGASFEVIETITININDKLSDVTKIDSGESGFAANYTTEQQAINSAIMATSQYAANKDAYYLIITNKKPTKQDEKGFMPLGRQFGYIFSESSETNKTIAHELGHGVFQLKHPFSTLSYNFSKGFTNWLMDYTTTTELPYAHWKQIQSPDWRIGVFDSDSEGELEKDFDLADLIASVLEMKGKGVLYCKSCEGMELPTVPKKNNFLKIPAGYKEILGSLNNSITDKKYYLVDNNINLDELKKLNNILKNKNYYKLYEREKYLICVIVSIKSENEYSYFTGSILNATNEMRNLVQQTGYDELTSWSEFLFVKKNDDSTQRCKILEGHSIGIQCPEPNNLNNIINDINSNQGIIDEIIYNIEHCAPLDSNLTTEERTSIKNALIHVKSSCRSNQKFEYSFKGKNYELNNNNEVVEVENAISDTNINNGNWTDSSKDIIVRITKDLNGVIKYKALGIRNNLSLFAGKTANLKQLASDLKNKSNSFFNEYNVKEIDDTPKKLNVSLNNNGEVFADGKKIGIDENSSFFKITSEAIGITTTLLKYAKVEEDTYLDSTQNTATIHAPGLVTGTIEAGTKVVTDITSMVGMAYDLSVDKKARTDIWNGLMKIKTQVGNDPSELLPILKDIVVEEATGNTPEDWSSITNSNTDEGKKGHLTTKGAVRTAVTIFTSGAIITKLPKMADDLVAKMDNVVNSLGDKLLNFMNKSLSQKLDEILSVWDTKYPIQEMLEGRSFFEDIMGQYRYLKSSGWSHTGDISPNFKGVDFYKGTTGTTNIFAETAVSMKTTITKNVDNWLASAPMQKNIKFLKEGLENTDGLISNGKSMFINKAEIHIYMPKANITPQLKTEWMNKLNTVDPRIKFEIKALEDFIN